MCCIAATVFSSVRAFAQEVGDPPAPEAAMAAYRTVDAWVREWKVADAKQGELALPSCDAASITLRLAGETIARGVEVATTPESRASVIAAAAKAALKEAEPKLGIPRDAMYEATRRDVAKQVTISIQLAGALIPISPKDAADAMAMVNPGVEGVGARLGDRLAVTFPERMLTTATEPGPALGTLVGKLAGDATLAVELLSKLAKDHGAVYYRFRVTHLAQTRVAEPPIFLKRCGKVVRVAEIDEAELRRWADEMARSTLARMGQGSASSLGVLDPCRGVDEPTEDFGKAALACALLTYATSVHDKSQKSAIVKEALGAIRAVVGGASRPSLPTSAMCAVALHEGRTKAAWWSDEGLRGIPGWRADALRAGFTRERGFDPGIPSAAQGLVAWFYVRQERHLHAWGTLEPPDTRNRDSVSAAFQNVAGGGLVGQLPWLGWAAAELNEGSSLPQAVALREVRSQLWQHQLQSETLLSDQQDLAGGILFTSSKQPMPTWQMARPLAFIATMLGDPRLTEEKEVPAELSRLLLSLRYLRQLTAGEAECFMYRSPGRAFGGVRSSLWDQRMPPEATAMTLLTVCETLRSLDEIRQRQEPKSK